MQTSRTARATGANLHPDMAWQAMQQSQAEYERVAEHQVAVTLMLCHSLSEGDGLAIVTSSGQPIVKKSKLLYMCCVRVRDIRTSVEPDIWASAWRSFFSFLCAGCEEQGHLAHAMQASYAMHMAEDCGAASAPQCIPSNATRQLGAVFKWLVNA
eukprot:5704739-Amphidinium_carterae.1